MVGVLGIAATPLRPGVLGMHFPSSTKVQFRGIRGFGQVAKAVAYFLQHLLAVATAVTGRKRFGSHLSVSFGFLSPLHVKACMVTMKGMKKMSLNPVLHQWRAGISALYYICILLTEMYNTM